MHVKAVAIGDGAVGKTCLLIRISSGSFPDQYIPTVFDNYILDLVIDNKNYQIGLWDTAGGEDYPRLRPLSYPQTDCFILCFSVSNKRSLENCYKYWYPEIQLFEPTCPIILVGTKADLYDDFSLDKSNFVKYDEAIQVANKIQAVEYIETSALFNKNVTKLFNQVAITSSNYRKLNKNDNFHFPDGFNVEASRFVMRAPGDNSKDSDISISSDSSDDYNEKMNQNSFRSKKKNCIIS